MFQYRNRHTGETVNSPERKKRLENLPQWDTIIDTSDITGDGADNADDSGMFSYRNRNTNVVATYDTRMRRLENLPQWDRVPTPAGATAETSPARSRAEAELELLHEAAERRTTEAALRDVEKRRRTDALAERRGGQVNVTRSHHQQDVSGDAAPVLAREGKERIDLHNPPGDGWARHEELVRQAAQEPAERYASQSGVLSRPGDPHADAAGPGAHAPAPERTSEQGKGAEEPSQADEVARPPKSANKDALVAWCAEHRHEDPAELGELNKDALWERVDAGPLNAPPAAE